MEKPDVIIAKAFDRHREENHNADYEVCQDLTCQAAFALESFYYPFSELTRIMLGLSLDMVKKDE